MLNEVFNQGASDGINKTQLIYMIAIRFMKIITLIDAYNVDKTVIYLFIYFAFEVKLPSISNSASSLLTGAKYPLAP